MYDKKRIIFVISSSIAGGGQIYLYNIVEYIKSKYSVLVLCPCGFLPDKLKSLSGIDIKTVDINVRNISTIRKIIIEEVDKFGKVYINAHLLGSALWAKIAIKGLSNCELSVTVHNKVIYNGISIIKRIFLPFVIRYIAASTDRFIAVSKEISDSVSKYSQKSCKYIPSSVPINPDSKTPRSSSEIKTNLKIGFVGRLSSLKNPVRFIETAHILLDSYPNLLFYIIGDGEMRSECEKVVDQYKRKENIKFLGFTKEPQRLMKELDVLVISSNSEGTPLVLLEAMAMGLPVVSTRVGAIPNVIDNEHNGLLSDELSAKSLATQIKKLVDDSALYNKISQNGYKTILEKFNYDKNITDYMSVVVND